MSEKFFDSNNLDAWEKAAAKQSPGGDIGNLVWNTPEGLAVKALYTKADVAGLEFADTLPGFAPYLRGPQPTMYAVKPWTIRQYAGFSTAEASNAFYRKALAAGGQAQLLAGLVKQRGPVGGLLEATRLTRALSRWFPGFGTATFYSSAPMRWGAYAGKLRLLPQQHGWDPRANRDWAADVTRRLHAGPLVYALQVQLFVDEQRTPIEDGRAVWSEADSPWLTVGVLTLPQQDPTSPAGQQLAAEVAADAFDPWAALAEHRPLGEIMRARKIAYYASQQARHADSSAADQS